MATKSGYSETSQKVESRCLPIHMEHNTRDAHISKDMAPYMVDRALSNRGDKYDDYSFVDKVLGNPMFHIFRCGLLCKVAGTNAGNA
jgi:hypothetical protein